jgi:PPP family 3-phenylpropionic acid transporter
LALYLSLGPLSEVVTIFYSQRWLARFGARKLMAVCLMVLAFRLLVTASSSNHWVLVLIQISHCLTFGTQHVVTLLVVNQLAGDAIRASAQTLTMVFSSYLSRLVGLAACGLIAGQVGIPALFCISAGLALLSLVLWLWLYHDTEETLVRERIR